MDSRRWPTVCLALAVSLTSGLICRMALAANNIQIEVEASAEEIFIGESVDFQVEIQNAANPTAPDLTAVKERFEVVELGNQSRNQSSMTIINGRVMQNQVFSHVYQYRLTPKDSGELTIPSVTVTIDGQELKSRKLPLRVQAPEKQDLVLLEVRSDQRRVYPTQPFQVTLGIWIRPLPSPKSHIDPLRPTQRNPPHLQINWVDVPAGLASNDNAQWLQPLLSQDTNGFTINDISARSNSFFGGARRAVFDLLKGRELREGIEGEPIEYYHYELTRSFTGEKTGTYTFGPASIKGTFAEGIVGIEYTPRRVVAVAPAVTVEVRDVPSPRPASYCGGIGDYLWKVSANPTELRVGDPLTVTLQVERGASSGSLDLISAPDLETIPQLRDDFELIDRNPIGKIEGSTKRFTYALRPKRANVQFPALLLSSFDPIAEQFTEIATSPIPLNVSEGASIKGGDLIGAIPSSMSSEIKSRTEGIFQNVTDPSVLTDQRIDLRRWTQAVASVWLSAGALIAWVHFYRRRSSDTVWLRKQQAKRTALRRLAEARNALQSGDSAESMRRVRASLLGLVADSKNLVQEGLTTADIQRALADTDVAEVDRREFSSLLESIESAEYGASQASDPSSTIASAIALIGRMARALEKGST